MDTIEFKTSASELWPGRQIDIFINGDNLIDLVREVELPFAEAEGSPSIAGGYAGLPSASHLPPSRHFMGQSSNSTRNRSVHLLTCRDCGEHGCWPLVADILVEDDTIIWKNFQQPHRSKPERLWLYDDFGPFVFDRSQYEAALMAISLR